MILGIGLDLVELSRIRAALERHADAFIRRIYTPTEAEYCRRMKDPVPHFAARFAAKEALSKALGTGIGPGAGWQDIEVFRADSGTPGLRLGGAAGDSAAALGVEKSHLSITHTGNIAAAVVILEG